MSDSSEKVFPEITSRIQNTGEYRVTEVKKKILRWFKLQWTLDLTNFYLTQSLVKRTFFPFTPVIVKYEEENLDITKDRGTGKICSL